jgi:hypothetical protein
VPRVIKEKQRFLLIRKALLTSEIPPARMPLSYSHPVTADAVVPARTGRYFSHDHSKREVAMITRATMDRRLLRSEKELEMRPSASKRDERHEESYRERVP